MLYKLVKIQMISHYLNLVCVCWSVFRYWSRGEPLHPKPDLCALTRCVFADPCSDTDHVGSHYIQTRFVCLDSVCVCWSVFRYWSRGEPLHPKPDLCALTRCVFADPCSDTDHVGSHYIQSQICVPWLGVCLLIRVQILITWGAITSKARFVCLDSVCVCWSVFRYWSRGEPLHPKPDLCALTRCVFADPCSDTDHVGSHYIQSQICVPWLGVCLLIRVQILITWGAITSKARFVCLDSVCVCWSVFRYWSRGEPLHPKPDLCALTRCVFADPCSDTDHVGSHYIQSQICVPWLGVCLLISVQILITWGAITSKARFVCLDSVCVCWSAFRYLLCWELLFPKPALPSLTQCVFADPCLDTHGVGSHYIQSQIFVPWFSVCLLICVQIPVMWGPLPPKPYFHVLT